MPRKKRCLRHTCLTVADVEKTSRQTLCLWRAEPYVVRVDCGVGQLRLGTNITPQGNALACLDILLVHAIYRPGTERGLSFFSFFTLMTKMFCFCLFSFCLFVQLFLEHPVNVEFFCVPLIAECSVNSHCVPLYKKESGDLRNSVKTIILYSCQIIHLPHFCFIFSINFASNICVSFSGEVSFRF